MGIRFDRELVRDAMQAMLRACDKRDQAIEEGIRACNDFIADTNLTGKAWQAAKADIQAHQKHDLELLRKRNEEHRRAARQTIDLADSAPYSMIDVDEGNALIARLKAIDSRIAAIPRQVEPSVRGEFQATADTMRGAVANYIAWIRRNNAIAEEIDQQGLAIWRPLNQPVNTSDNAGQAVDTNAVMAKFLDDKISKKNLIKLFVTQFGMTSEQAKMIAEFTDRFRKYAKKRKNKGDRRWQTDADIFRQYVRILASAGGYNNLLWRTAGDTMSASETEEVLTAMGYGKNGSPTPRKFMQAIGQIHRADAGTIDFIHMMGSMSCILNAGAGAGLYEQLTQDPETGYSHDKNGHLKVAPGNANRAPEAATWGGDIASGKMGSADMNADMDAINLNDLIKRNPGRNPMELMNQYYQNVAKDPSYRADQFCQHYDPDGTRDPDKGYQWLQDNGYHLSTAPLGDKGLAVLNQATPSKQSDAFDQFMDSIDQQRHQ